MGFAGIFLPMILSPLTLAALTIAAIGLFWSPAAALSCALTARRLGLPMVKFAIAGGLYSILMFMPWVYLDSRMNGEPLSRNTVRRGFISVYVLLLLGPVAIFGNYWVFGIIADADRSRWTPSIWLFAFLVSTALWLLSLKLVRRMGRDWPHEGQSDTTSAAIHWSGLLPFGLLFVWVYLVVYYVVMNQFLR